MYCTVVHFSFKLLFVGKVCNGEALTTFTGVCAAGFYCREGAATDRPNDGGTTGAPCILGHYCLEGACKLSDKIPEIMTTVSVVVRKYYQNVGWYVKQYYCYIYIYIFSTGARRETGCVKTHSSHQSFFDRNSWL